MNDWHFLFHLFINYDSSFLSHFFYGWLSFSLHHKVESKCATNVFKEPIELQWNVLVLVVSKFFVVLFLSHQRVETCSKELKGYWMLVITIQNQRFICIFSFETMVTMANFFFLFIWISRNLNLKFI